MKKKLLLLLMATMSMLTATAQDGSLPMLEEGRVWNKLALHLAYPGEGDRAEPYMGAECNGVPFKHVIKGDTVIDGRTYKKIYHGDWYNPTCMRQEGPRVYMYDYLGDKKDALLYDFSLKERDSITISEDNRLVVDKVDTVKVDGISRRRLIINQYGEYWVGEYFVDIWVEGIGGFVSAPCSFHAWQTTGYPPVTTSCEQDGKVIFTDEDFFKQSIAMTCYDIDSDDRISAYSSHEFFLTGRTENMANHSWSLLLPLTNGGMQTVATSDTQSLTIPAITNEKQYAINASGEIVGEILYNGTVRGTNISISHTVRLQLKPRIISVEVVEQKRNELDAGYFDLTFDIKYEGCSYIYATIEEVENNLMFDNFSYVPDSTRLEFKKIDPSVELWLTVEASNDYGKDIYSMEIEGLKNDDIAYRPFVEDGKVWVVRCNPALGISDASWIEYYYFDGDSIIDGHRCKIMKSVSNVNEDNWVNGVFTPDGLPQYYVGAFYEQDRKVYYKQNQQPFEQIYDFTLSSNDIYSSWGYPVAVQKISGVIPGFKGTYYEFWLDNQILGRWFEGIGCNTSLPYISHPWNYYGGGSGMLLSCFVGDEVIYLNNEYEDGVIPIEARKGRFDFTHTIKTQPRAPRKREVNSSSLYGEYNEQKLTIHLDPLYDTYLVRITDETGKAVYEKTVNTSTIVGLNIDISAYAAGRYAVIVENSRESFSGEFRILTTEIKEVRNGNKEAIDVIYNLQGQRLSGKPAKGVYIENGKKRLVK